MTSRFSSVAWQNPNFNKLHFEKQNRFGVPKKIFGSKKDLGVQKRFGGPKKIFGSKNSNVFFGFESVPKNTKKRYVINNYISNVWVPVEFP